MVNNNNLEGWNACARFFNITSDEGLDAAKKYANSLSEEARVSMWEIFNRIKRDGYEATKAATIRAIGD